MISLDQGQLAAVRGLWGRKLERCLRRRGYALSMVGELRFDAGIGRDLEIISNGGQLDLEGNLPFVAVRSEFWADEKGLHVRLQEIWAAR